MTATPVTRVPLTPLVVPAKDYGSATGHVEPQPILEPVEGEITLGLEDQIVCPLPDALTGRPETRSRPAHVVLTRFADLMRPGLFDPEPDELEPEPFAPGYTVERHPEVDVIWPTRSQEAVDPTIRFRPTSKIAGVLLERLGAWCARAIAEGSAPMIEAGPAR